jgi:hypothetical protein
MVSAVSNCAILFISKIREMEMRKVLLAMLALFALTAVPAVYADDEPLPDVQAVDSPDDLPPLMDAGDSN